MRRQGAPERFIATVLFVDIVGSTEVAARLGSLVTPNDTFFVSERVGNVQLHQQWGILLDQLWVEYPPAVASRAPYDAGRTGGECTAR